MIKKYLYDTLIIPKVIIKFDENILNNVWMVRFLKYIYITKLNHITMWYLRGLLAISIQIVFDQNMYFNINKV